VNVIVLAGHEAIDETCARLAREAHPIVLYGTGRGGLLAYQIAARSRRPIAIVTSTLGFVRRSLVAVLARRATPVVEPEHFDVCPILLAHPGADRAPDLAYSRRFFDRLVVPKRMVVGVDPLEAAAAFLADLY